MQTSENRSRIFRSLKVVVPLILSAMIALLISGKVMADPIHFRLNPDLVAGGSIKDYAVSPDGEYVAYIADQETLNVNELYVVPVRGGATIKLNPPLIAGGDVYRLVFAPNSQYIVYIATQEDAKSAQLYSVPTTGGASVNISGAPPAESGIRTFRISPDSKWVLYGFEKNFYEFGLMSTPIDHADPVSLTLPNHDAAAGYRGYFDFTPDSQFVVFRTEGSRTESIDAIFKAPIHGGALTALVPPLVNGESIFLHSFTPNVDYVLYSLVSGTTRSLYTVSVNGGTPTQIGESEQGTILIPNHRSAYSPDGSKALIRVVNSDPNKLYVVPVNGGEPFLLSSSDDIGDGSGLISDARFVLGGKGVVLTVDSSSYLVPTSGGDKTLLFGPLFTTQYFWMPTPNGENIIHSVSFDGQQPAYLALSDLKTQEVTTLTTNSIYGGPPLSVSPDGTSVIYPGKIDANAGQQLLKVSLSDRATTVFSAKSPVDTYWYYGEPVINKGQICYPYLIATNNQYPYNPRELYVSCYDADWPFHAHLPLIGR